MEYWIHGFTISMACLVILDVIVVRTEGNVFFSLLIVSLFGFEDDALSFFPHISIFDHSKLGWVIKFVEI